MTEDINTEIENRPLAGKFCWAGLIMPHFWGIGNELPIALLAFIPIIYPFMALYFGFSGYKIAYEKAKNSMGKEEFCKKQKIWEIVSFVYIIAFIAIIFSFNAKGLSNYIHNKKELNLIIRQTEEQKSRLAEEVVKLTDVESLRPLVDGMECTVEGEVQFNDNNELWNLKNNYGYEELSRDNVRFGQPWVLDVSQEFLVEDGRILTITFSVDENFQIQEGSYSIYSGAEVHLLSPGLYTNLDEIGLYMDEATVDLILNRPSDETEFTEEYEEMMQINK